MTIQLRPRFFNVPPTTQQEKQQKHNSIRIQNSNPVQRKRNEPQFSEDASVRACKENKQRTKNE